MQINWLGRIACDEGGLCCWLPSLICVCGENHGSLICGCGGNHGSLICMCGGNHGSLICVCGGNHGSLICVWFLPNFSQRQVDICGQFLTGIISGLRSLLTGCNFEKT